MKLLNMTNAKLIRHSPDKKNVYHMQNAADLDEAFQWMLNNLVSPPVTEIPKNNYLLLLIERVP